ncbi:MAG: cyclic nucleotide-binding domain-containing protein [Syntrophorhabdales bacterium]|jgi:CRP-like cAMP-binding protein
MAIMESDLFKGVSQRFITRIANGAEEQAYKRGSTIFTRGETATHFYVLAAGDVHIEIGETEKATLAISRPGEVFGWSALVEPYTYTATARCPKETKVIRVSRDIVEAAIKEHPAEGLAILKNLTGIIAGRLRYAYRQLVPEA